MDCLGCLKGAKKVFLTELNSFIKEQGFKEVILLSSIPQSMVEGVPPQLYFSSFDLAGSGYNLKGLVNVKDYQPNSSSVFQSVDELLESSGLSGVFSLKKQFKV